MGGNRTGLKDLVVELKSNTWGEESACQSWEAGIESQNSRVGNPGGMLGVGSQILGEILEKMESACKSSGS